MVYENLIAYYPFTGNALDRSGNGNNGTVTGATLTTDRFGNSNSAYYFNGTTDYIILSTDDSLEFGTSKDFTIYVSFYAENEGQLISTTSDVGQDEIGFFIYPSTLNGLTFGIGDGTEYPDATDTIIYSGVDVVDGEWHNACLTGDRDGLMKAYVDGEFISSIDISGIGDIDHYPFNFGREGSNRRFFKGKIEEIRIYNVVLSELDCKRLSNNNISIRKDLKVFAQEFDENGITDGLIAYWNFTEGSGTAFYNKEDKSTYEGLANLTYSTWTDRGIKTDNASERVKVSVPTTSSDFNSGDLTITHRFIPTTLSGTVIFCRYVWRFLRSGSNNISFAVGRMNDGTGPTYILTSSGEELQIGKEIHLCGLYHPDAVGGNGYIKFYINGNYIGESNIGTDIMYTAYGSTTGVRWGTTNHGTWTPFEAEHIESKIFNRILTEEEIALEASIINLKKPSNIKCQDLNEYDVVTKTSFTKQGELKTGEILEV